MVKKSEQKTKEEFYNELFLAEINALKAFFKKHPRTHKQYEQILIDKCREMQRNYLNNCQDEPIFTSMIKY
jgi:hypothetical protein